MSIIQDSIKSVPSVKYALGIAGISTAGSLVMATIGSGRASIILMTLMISGMILLFVFSRLIRTQSKSIALAAVFLLWSVLIFFVTFLVLTVSAVTMQWPSYWAVFLGITPSSAAEKAVFSKEETSIVLKTQSWFCSALDSPFDLDKAITSFPLEKMPQAQEKIIDKKADKEYISKEFISNGRDYSIEYHYQYKILKPNDIYGMSLSLEIKDHADNNIYASDIKKKTWLSRFGELESNFFGGIMVGSSLRLFGSGNPAFKFDTWPSQTAMRAEWFSDEHIRLAKRLCLKTG